jgi:hypothetical protein
VVWRVTALLDQANRLVGSARLLPADEAAKLLEQVVTIAQAAQAEVLAAAERSGDLKDSGCRTARSFTTTILRRSGAEATAVAQVALHLVAFPQLAAAYRAGLAHTGNLRTIMRHLKSCGLAALQAHEPQLLMLATKAGPREIDEFCRHVADLNQPDRDESRAKALGQRSVRIVRVGDLAHLDAMLDPGGGRPAPGHPGRHDQSQQDHRTRRELGPGDRRVPRRRPGAQLR